MFRMEAISSELTSPRVNILRDQRKKIKDLESSIVTSPGKNAIFKNVLHKGYWKYKVTDFSDNKERKVKDKIKKAED